MANETPLPAMKSLDETTALAILFANTKRKKRTADLVSVAEACQYLAELYESKKAVAERVGLSAEMVREFLAILHLPTEVKDMIRSRQIDRLDVAYRIAQLNDADKQLQMAKEVRDVKTEDVRDIARLTRRTGLPAEEAKRRVLESKIKGLHVFIIDFDDMEYRKITDYARAKRMNPAQLVQKAVLDWLGQLAGASSE